MKVSQASTNPACHCGVPSKMVTVKKDGPNKDRCFYACSANRKQQCKVNVTTEQI